jgi:hypothetical protein
MFSTNQGHGLSVYESRRVAVAAQAQDLAARGTKGLAYARVQVLACVNASDQLGARQSDVDAHFESVALVVVVMRHAERYTAGHDAVGHTVKLFGGFARGLDERVARRDADETDP